MASTKKPAAKKTAPKKTAPKKTAAGKTASKKPASKKTAARVVPAVSPNRDKTLSWYLSTLPPWQTSVGEALTEIVTRAVPRAEASIKWSQPVWELNGPFLWLKGSKAHLSLGFWRGAELDDPARLLEGDGDRMRHVKIWGEEGLRKKEIEKLVKQAASLNVTKGDPTKRS